MTRDRTRAPHRRDQLLQAIRWGGVAASSMLVVASTAFAHLVFDVPSPPSPAATAGAVTRFATLPEAASSFGAVASDGWLYIYGGHIAPTHHYSTASVSGQFNRLNLSERMWEALPSGPPLQGMNLAAYHGRIYRVGGMQPRNPPGQPDDVESVGDAARFDPATNRWEALPPLAAPRSSHDVVVVADQLVVVGGWTLRGKKGTEWAQTLEVMDLAATTLRWQSLPQPFKRRAFVATVLDGKLYVIGGFNERAQVERQVKVYDVQRGRWSDGPTLPAEAQNSFGPAACTSDGYLYVSLDDGGLFRLDADGEHWTQIGQATPRIVHRLAPVGDEILVIGGAEKTTNSDLIEAVHVEKP